MEDQFDDELKRQEEIDEDIEKREKQYQFLDLLKANKISVPNDFLTEMGERIRKTREDLGITQAELARRLNRRQATVSDIENGKSELGILTLLQFAVVLDKPISYFFSETLLREWLVEIKTPFQHKALDLIKEIEEFSGDEELVLDLLKTLENLFEGRYHDSFTEDQPYP